MRRLRLGSEQAVLVALILLLAAIAVWPLLRLLLEAAPGRGAYSVLLERQIWIAAEHTIVSALLGTLVALAIGVPAALAITLTDIRGKPALVFALMLPLIIPPQIVASAWIELCGPASPLLRPLGLAPRPGTPHPLYGLPGVSLLLGVEQAPLVFLTLAAGLRALPRELIEAAEAAGAGFWRRLRTILLPLAAAPLTAGAALAFVAAIGNFGTPALLGIPGGYGVLTTLIYQKLAGFGPAILGEVALLSLLLAIIAAGGLALQSFAASRFEARGVAQGVPPRQLELGRWRLPIEVAAWAVIFLIVLLPFAALVATSLVPAYGVPLSFARATLENYRFILFENPAAQRAALDSLALAAMSALILALLALPLGLFAAWRRSRAVRVASLAAELPYALPGIVLAIAMILVFLRPLPILGVSLYNTLWILLIAYLSRFLTLALRTVTAGYRQLDRAMEEAAQMAGAGFVRRLRDVLAPLLAPAMIAGGLLVFLTALNELTLSILLWSSGHETLGIMVFSLEQGGDHLSAAALAVLAIAATLLLMLAAGRLGRHLPRGAVPWLV